MLIPHNVHAPHTYLHPLFVKINLQISSIVLTITSFECNSNPRFKLIFHGFCWTNAIRILFFPKATPQRGICIRLTSLKTTLVYYTRAYLRFTRRQETQRRFVYHRNIAYIIVYYSLFWKKFVKISSSTRFGCFIKFLNYLREQHRDKNTPKIFPMGLQEHSTIANICPKAIIIRESGEHVSYAIVEANIQREINSIKLSVRYTTSVAFVRRPWCNFSNRHLKSLSTVPRYISDGSIEPFVTTHRSPSRS